MDEDGKKAYMAELHKERQVRVTVTLKMEGFPPTMDSDDETDEEEVLMVITDPEYKLMDIFGAMEKKDEVGRKLKEAGMKKLRMGVPMQGGMLRLTMKSAAKDKGMASQEIQHLKGFKKGTVRGQRGSGAARSARGELPQAKH